MYINTKYSFLKNFAKNSITDLIKYKKVSLFLVNRIGFGPLQRLKL